MADHAASCVICRDAAPHDVIGESEHCWVTAAVPAPLPGYVCVVSKTHVSEPFDLSPDQQAAFWPDVCSVAQAVRDAVAAAKINYEIHGNTIPHLHLHVFPPLRGRPVHRQADRWVQPRVLPLRAGAGSAGPGGPAGPSSLMAEAVRSDDAPASPIFQH